MIATNTEISIHVDDSRLRDSVAKFRAAMEQFSKVFEDRDKWHATTEGEWPDRFTLLNRFVRTGARPPYIFND